jgi:hypothetical protein
MVVFQHQVNSQDPRRETYLTNVPVVAESEDGVVQYSARLSELVPQALKNDETLSPIKSESYSFAPRCLVRISHMGVESTSRLFRAGVADPHSQSSLGLVNDLLDPAQMPASLKIDALNRYPLEKTKDNMFACRLFWKEVDDDKAGKASHPVSGYQPPTPQSRN